MHHALMWPARASAHRAASATVHPNRVHPSPRGLPCLYRPQADLGTSRASSAPRAAHHSPPRDLESPGASSIRHAKMADLENPRPSSMHHSQHSEKTSSIQHRAVQQLTPEIHRLHLDHPHPRPARRTGSRWPRVRQERSSAGNSHGSPAVAAGLESETRRPSWRPKLWVQITADYSLARR